MGKIGEDIAVESWLFKFGPCSRLGRSPFLPTLPTYLTLPYLTLTDSGIERPLGLEDPLSSSSDTVGTVRALYGRVYML